MHPVSRSYKLGLAAVLIAAPLLELAESALSPLTDGSTADDLHAIAAHRSAFVASVLLGIVSTVLFVPAFLGLARLAWSRTRVLAAVAGAVAVASMLGFMGVRMLQAAELAMVDHHLAPGTASALLDGATGNPLGAVIMVLFLGGTVVGVVCLAVAVWRARLAPLPAPLLLVAFPVLDLGTNSHLGTVVAHAVGLAGLAWIGLSIARPAAITGSVPEDTRVDGEPSGENPVINTAG